MLKDKLLPVGLIVLAIVWMQSRRVEPAVPVLPDRVVDDLGVTPKLQSVFRDAAHPDDALYFAAVFQAAAERIEADGQQAAPAIVQRAQIEQFVERCGRLATASKTAGNYPGLPKVIAELFQVHFPRDPGKLTPEDRVKAVRCFKALAVGCADSG